MSLVQVETASIRWNPEKRHWIVSITIGEEVINRSALRSLPRDAPNDILRAWAVATAQEEGYTLSADEVIIARG